MLSDRSLFQRLNDFALDDASAQFKFSDRLARENGWSLAFAKQAISEYKKFVYLTATSQMPVTPSDIVDQVWHLHLTYSRSYWNEMCGEVLGKPLHHGPTKGGAAQDANYRNLYAATLATYRREFDCEPPAVLWPASGARFESAAHQRWVDTRRHLVLSWRSLARAAAIGAGAIALGSTSLAFAAAATKAQHDFTPALIMLAGVVLVAIVAMAARGKSSRGGSNGSDSGVGIWGTGGFSRHDQGHGHGHGNGGHDGGGHSSGCSSGGDGGGSGCSGGGGCSS